MRKVIRIKEGKAIPDGAKYLSSKDEPCKVRYEWRPSPGLMGAIPIFGTETQYRITSYETVNYYEIEENTHHEA